MLAYPYKGYWTPADTVKERAQLEEMYYRGNCPWMVWDPERSGAGKVDRRPTSWPPTGWQWPRHDAIAAAEPRLRGRAAVGARDRRAPRRHRDRGGRHPAQPGRAPSRAARQVRADDRDRRAPAGGAGRGPRVHCRARTSTWSCTTCPTGGCPPSRSRSRRSSRPRRGRCARISSSRPSAADAHQDHRTVGELVPTAFRDQLCLGYEIPKWDGDLTRPNAYFPLTDDIARRKTELLDKCYPSQRGRDWWGEETFLALARLRGMECRARYAEAFTCTKLVIP